MTREEIMATPAGRDLDRLVAEAMGCKVFRGRDGVLVCGCDMNEDNDWPHGEVSEGISSCVIAAYSIDIAAAWKVWEAMLAIVVELSLLQDAQDVVLDYAHGGHIRRVRADTVPLAICRAFLLLKECGK